MSDYSNSMARQSGAMTLFEYRKLEAFKQGQRDAEQGWSEDALRWDLGGPFAEAYREGYKFPRSSSVHTFRVFYRYENDEIEYSALVNETTPDAATRALMQADRVTIVRVERVD